RAAIAALERNGVDAEQIRLIDTPGARTAVSGARQRERDARVTNEVGMRGTSTALIGAGCGALAGGLAAWFASGGQAMPTFGAALGFFAAGGALGFFYGGASALSVSEGWAETFGASGPATLAVHASPDDIIDLRDVIARTDPVEVVVVA
ncbi:MAG: hypothetical protein QOI47_1079, partial [Actinomycetota bacterium]|nr:hypothetical protein [Actinomycetota bacterium]